MEINQRHTTIWEYFKKYSTISKNTEVSENKMKHWEPVSFLFGAAPFYTHLQAPKIWQAERAGSFEAAIKKSSHDWVQLDNDHILVVSSV